MSFAEAHLAQRPAVNLKVIGVCLVLVASLFIGFTNPWAPALSPLGHKVVMALLITVSLWIFKPGNMPLSIAGCVLIVFFLILGFKPADALSGFTNNALWVMIPALFFGYVLQKTGLGLRIAYLVLKLFKPSYSTMIAAWIIIGLILSVLTPSITVRVAIVMPLALACVEACQFPLKSKGRSLILLITWAMALMPGAGWLTGSLGGPMIMGMFNGVPELQGMITFSSWARVCLLPVEIISVLLIVGGYFVLKPKEKLTVTKEVFEQEYAKLGKMSTTEKAAGVILALCFIMFATSQYHHIPDAATCLAGLVALTIFGVINGKDIGSGISWDLIIFVGVALSIGTVSAQAGVSKWLAGVIVPILAPVAKNPWTFVYAVLLALFVWRFIDVAVLIPTMSILTPILPAISKAYGINPLVWAPIYVIAFNCFLLSYQNMFALVAESIAGEKGWTANQFFKFGLVYLAASLIAMLVAIPYWNGLHLFG